MLCFAVCFAEPVWGQPPRETDRDASEGPGRREDRSREDRRDRRERGSSRGGDPRQEAPAKTGAAKDDADSTPRRRTPRTGASKTAAVLALPTQYITKDANKDGQVGMYEWSQTDLATFRKLDLNGDGFLIPSELVNPGGRTGSSAESATITPSVAAKSGSPTERAGSPTAAPKSAVPMAPPADPLLAAAETNFALWDVNKNGQLDQEEFTGTVRLERVFEKAKLKFEGPMPKDKFLQTYVQAIKSKSTGK